MGQTDGVFRVAETIETIRFRRGAEPGPGLAAPLALQREDPGRFNGAVDEARRDRPNARNPMQAVTDEMFVLVQIRDDDTQEIIRLTGQQKAVQYLIGVLYPLLETLDGLAFMALQCDADEGRDLKAAGPHVDIRGVANDHTSLFEKAHPSQARGRGEVHAFCQVLVGQPAIALQLPNDLAIFSINPFHWLQGN